MSTRIHQNNVHEKSPQKRNSSGQKCPREFVKSVHENSPILSTRIRLLCPLEFFHPKIFAFWAGRILTPKILIPRNFDCGYSDPWRFWLLAYLIPKTVTFLVLKILIPYLIPTIMWYNFQDFSESNWILGEKAQLKLKGNAKTLFLKFLFGMHAQ